MIQSDFHLEYAGRSAKPLPWIELWLVLAANGVPLLPALYLLHYPKSAVVYPLLLYFTAFLLASGTALFGCVTSLSVAWLVRKNRRRLLVSVLSLALSFLSFATGPALFDAIFTYRNLSVGE